MTPTRAIPMPKNSDESGIRSSGFWNLENHMNNEFFPNKIGIILDDFSKRSSRRQH